MGIIVKKEVVDGVLVPECPADGDDMENRPGVSDYQKFRGKCKELSLALIKENPTWTLVRGHYVCPVWNSFEEHWWVVDEQGTVHDPSARQFPSKGNGTYIPFDGTCTCAECGEVFEEGSPGSVLAGNYTLCSNQCALRLVGLA